MKIIKTLFRWLINVCMVFSLLFGITYLFTAKNMRDMAPQSAAELETKNVTVQHVFNRNKHANIMVVEEYPDGFFVVPTKSRPESDAPELDLHSGDKILIGIRKDDLSKLNLKDKGVIVWSINDTTGKQLLDMQTTYGANILDAAQTVTTVCYVLICIPLLYFIIMIILRQKKKNALRAGK